MTERGFKGIWIPAEVWLDTRLSALDKSVLAEIDSLDNEEDGCWASNEYLAKFCQCSEWKISTTISKLIDLGYLKRISFDGRKRKLKSSIGFSQTKTLENHKADMGKSKEINIDESIEEKIDNIKTCIDDGFEAFYSLYPKKKAKQDALKAWQALKPGNQLQETIKRDIKSKLKGEWNIKDKRFIPFPATYLRGRRWEDESEMNTFEEHTRPSDDEIRASITPEQQAIIDEINANGWNHG